MEKNVTDKKNMNKSYTLEFLSKEFGKHSEIVGTDEFYDEDEFNFALALKTIVDALVELQNEKQSQV
jgi:hypothetical protein